MLIEVVPEDYPKPIGNPADRDVAAIIRLQPMSGDVCFLSMSSLKGDIEHRTMLDLQKDNVDVNQEVAKRSKSSRAKVADSSSHFGCLRLPCQ